VIAFVVRYGYSSVLVRMSEVKPSVAPSVLRAFVNRIEECV